MQAEFKGQSRDVGKGYAEKLVQRKDSVKTQKIHHLQAKEYLRPSEARKETWDGFPSAALGRNQHCDNLVLNLLSHNCETLHFFCVSHLICDTS